MPARLWIGVAVVVVLALVVGGLLWLRRPTPTTFERAVARAPQGAERLSWTDWAAVRRHEGVDLSDRSSVSDLRRFLNRAYDDDLSSASALVTSAPVLQERYGFSPASLDWELFSQSYQGAVVIMHVSSSVDLDDVANHLSELGYTPPAGDSTVWNGGTDLVARISSALTPELSYLALDRADGLILASDTAAYLTTAARIASGEGPRVAGLGGVVADAGEPMAAAVYTGSYACGALAMAHAGPSDQAEGRQLLARAGAVTPYTAFAMADEPDGSVRVSLQFDSDSAARTNADSRATLARGPAPGQGGTFGQRFSVGAVTAHGSLLRMQLTPRKGAYVLSDLSTGPVLFATC